MNAENNGLTISEADGRQYFIYGKSRIRIVEHFSKDGPTLENALSKLIQQQIREKSA